VRGTLTEKVRALIPEATPDYLALLEERLRALARVAGEDAPFPANLGSAESRRGARHLLDGLEGEWDDGDETLVRDELDSWGPGDRREVARRLLRAAEILGHIDCRRGTVAFFLWEMESLLGEFAP